MQSSAKNAALPCFTPTVFTRHNRFLHAFIQDHQAWFCAQDLGRLMG